MMKIAITMGDPAGIGPEIICKTGPHFASSSHDFFLVGSPAVLSQTADALGLDHWQFAGVTDPYPVQDIVSGQLSAKAGKAAYSYVVAAAKMALAGEVDAIVTGPINKMALNLAGVEHAGHTEILAQICGSTKYTMFLSGAGLNVFHVSTHISLGEAIERVKTARILEVITLANETLLKLGHPEPRIAVCGLNPHAGEGGLFGSEDKEEILPAVQQAAKQNIAVFGPEPPDTVFVAARNGKYQGVVVMYHDQGHIPLKLLGFDQGVNITIGLPIVRTSVDHGTAFDIAGKGVASEASMVKAIEMALQLSEFSGR